MTRIFGCRRFRKLVNERYDRDLSHSETKFLERHRGVCSECARTETNGAMALNMLRMASLDEGEVAPHFDERLIRQVRLDRVRQSVGYWSPAFVGATIAGIAIVAALQLIARSDSPVVHTGPFDQSHRIAPKGSSFPALNLDSTHSKP